MAKNILLKCLPLLIFAVFSFAQKTQAQRIHFCDSLNHWTTTGSDAYGNPTNGFYWYKGDITIGSNNYRIMTDSFVNYCCLPVWDTVSYYYVREDTIGGLVYVLYNDTDRILYNYNLVVGDTFSGTFLPNPTYAYIDTVARIRNIIIGSMNYKIWDYFECDAFIHYLGYDSYWVTKLEGIGCVFGPLFPIDTFQYDVRQENLDCFSNPDSFTFSFSYINYGSVLTNYINCDSNLGANQYTIPSMILAIYPNPIAIESEVSFGKIIIEGTLQFYDLTGRLIYSKSLENESKVTIKNIFPKSGLYICKVIDYYTGAIQSSKVLYNP